MGEEWRTERFDCNTHTGTLTCTQSINKVSSWLKCWFPIKFFWGFYHSVPCCCIVDAQQAPLQLLNQKNKFSMSPKNRCRIAAATVQSKLQLTGREITLHQWHDEEAWWLFHSCERGKSYRWLLQWPHRFILKCSVGLHRRTKEHWKKRMTMKWY